MKNIIRDIFSRSFFQPFFEALLNFCLKVLNIGEGQGVESSGEKSVFPLLERVSSQESVIFDVGAHTGEWLRLLRGNTGGGKNGLFV